MSSEHKFLSCLLPRRAFDALRMGTKAWLEECPCGNKRDLWDAGGLRYKASGEPRRLVLCQVCGKRTLHKIRRKTEAERRELP